MKEELISFETAKLAKEKGFEGWFGAVWDGRTDTPQIHFGFSFNNKNDHGSDFYDKWYSAPTQSLLQKWLREEEGIGVEVNYGLMGYDYTTVDLARKDLARGIRTAYAGSRPLDTYEEALEKGLYEALKLIDNE